MKPRSHNIIVTTAVIVLMGLMAAAGCKTPQTSQIRSDPLKGLDSPFRAGPNFPRRLENLSPVYPLDQGSFDLHADYAYANEAGAREFQLGIKAKMTQMIRDARSVIVGSFFLFDCLYPEVGRPGEVPAGSPLTPDFVEQITTQLIEKKIANPDIAIVLILDPINRAYMGRVGPQISRLLNAGVVVLFSDLASTPNAIKPTPSGDEVLGPILSGMSFQVSEEEAAATLAAEKFAEMHRQMLSQKNLQEELISPAMAEHLEPAFAAVRTSFVGSWLEPTVTGKELVRIVKEGGDIRDEAGRSVLVDNEPVNLEFFYNAMLLKANHRRILLTDSAEGTGRSPVMEALIGSADPHNASLPSANFGVSVTGDLAHYIYRVVRDDILYSNERAWLNFRLHKHERDANRYLLGSAIGGAKVELPQQDYVATLLPEDQFPLNAEPKANGEVSGRFVTEGRIKETVLDILGQVESGDEVRLQMMYLTDLDVIEAIVKAASRLQDGPALKILLDPNRNTRLGMDGTPNRQVADYLFQTTGGEGVTTNLDLRWYATNGERNHARVMSVTNAKSGKYLLLTGSAALTGNQLSGANMESLLVISGSETLVQKFNQLFDSFWNNENDPQGKKRIFSLPYDTPPHNQPIDEGRSWVVGEATGLVHW